MADKAESGKAWGSSSGSWADAEDDNDEEVAHSGGSAWGAPPVDHGNGPDEGRAGRFSKDDFPEVGSQPARGRRTEGPSGNSSGRGTYNNRGGVRDERDQGYPEERDRSFGAKDRYREDRPKYDDRGRDYDNRDRNYGSRERERGYGESRDRDRGYGERDKAGYRGREREYGGRTGDREERPPVPFPTSAPWTAHVSNLSYDVHNDDIDQFFSDHGCKVDQIRLLTDKEGKMRGYGYVEFVDEESLRSALDCHDMELLGRPVRVGIAERRKESGFVSRRDNKEGSFNRRESDDGEAKTWRSQRLARAPVSDPLHADRSAEDEAPVKEETASKPKPKPKSNPFGDAKPRDELEAQKRLIELQQKQEEEEKKKREDEKRKREEEALKKKQEKEAQKQKDVKVESKPASTSSNWRTEKSQDGTKPASWGNKKRGGEATAAGGRGAEGKREAKTGQSPPPRGSQQGGKRFESAGPRGNERRGGPAGRGRGKSPVAETKDKTPPSQPPQQKEAKKPQQERAPRAESKVERAPPTLVNSNAFALLADEEI